MRRASMGAESPDDGSRRNILDLISIYEFYPEITDIFVEGDWDQRLLRWILKEVNIPEPVVYSIDSIDIPFEILVKYGLTEGRKQRVVALANELQDKVHDQAQVTCIAGRDFDSLLGKSY